MGNPTILERIQAELDDIAETDAVRILYACESGSRAWGFESTDSDYDVRFIYAHPVDWYLSVDEKRDVIERPIDDVLDVSGWDLKKALGLLRKSNPPLLEWLQSPTVYRSEDTAMALLREVMPEYYSPKSCLYHYLHMARGNYRDYLKQEEVKSKKYLYVLRPILACLWIERDLGLVPMEFHTLLDRLVDDAQLRADIDELVARKKAGAELDRGPRIPSISTFLDEQLARLSGEHARPAKSRDPEGLSVVFRKILGR